MPFAPFSPGTYSYTFEKIESIDEIQSAIGDCIYVEGRGRVPWEFCKGCDQNRHDLGYHRKKLYVYVSVSNINMANLELYSTHSHWQRIFTFCNKQCLDLFCLVESVTPEYPKVKFLWKDSLINFMNDVK